MAEIICEKCKKKVEHHAKLKCITCYKKDHWKPKLVICKRCKRERPQHAKGLCDGCYNSVFHIDSVKLHNARRYHKIDSELYKKITKKCFFCDFDKIVDLHHIDNNHKNNTENNLIGVCPNHHKMLHHRSFRIELFNILEGKGLKTPEIYEDDEVFKK